MSFTLTMYHDVVTLEDCETSLREHVILGLETPDPVFLVEQVRSTVGQSGMSPDPLGLCLDGLKRDPTRQPAVCQGVFYRMGSRDMW